MGHYLDPFKIDEAYYKNIWFMVWFNTIQSSALMLVRLGEAFYEWFWGCIVISL